MIKTWEMVFTSPVAGAIATYDPVIFGEGKSTYKTGMIYAVMQPPVGGTYLYIALQTSPNEGNIWFDYVDFQLSLPGSEQVLALPISRNSSANAMKLIGKNLTPGIGGALQGDWGDRMRAVAQSHPSTTEGAEQRIIIMLSE